MNNLQNHIENYLDYCRTQKCLDKKTLKAYRIDLRQFSEQIYLNFIIKNHTEYNMENVCIKAVDNYDDLFIVEPSKGISTISMMSDYGIHFFCVYRGVNKEQKIPDYEITYLQNGETKHEIIHNLSISLKNIVRIPLTGKKVNEFIGNKWSEIIDLIKRRYCQILMIHGKSGTGKTRLVEEIISISKQNNFSTKYFDCKNKNGATILKNILSFILEVPFDNNSLQYSKEDIKQIIENEYGKQEYTDYLYTVFYMRTNNFYLAKEHGDNAYKIATELNDNFLISTACSDIAFNYLYNKKDYENAKMYFEKAIDYYSNCEDRTYFRILEIHNQKALVYFFKKEYKKAIKELNKSISKSKQKNNMYMEAKALNYKGIVQTHSQNYKEALATWKTAIRLNEKLDLSQILCKHLIAV